MPKYNDTYQEVEHYRHQSAEALRIKFEPIYKKYWPETLAQTLGCNIETVRKYRSKKNPRKPTYEYYVLLSALLDENIK